MITVAYLLSVAVAAVVLAVTLRRRPAPPKPPAPAPTPTALPKTADAEVRRILAAAAQLSDRLDLAG